MKNGFNLDAAKTSIDLGRVDWDNDFVDDLKRALTACRVFTAFPVLWLLHTQILNNMVSQAATTDTSGLPNDIFNSMNPLAVLILLPLVQKVLYPRLRKASIAFPPINRLATGFLIESLAIAYCAGFQQMIYTRGPCYNFPLMCKESQSGTIPNKISVWLQTPVYVVDALGEIFFDLGSQEYAYNMAPDGMKSIMQAMISFMSALGAVLGWTLVPATRNPHLVIMYGTMAGAMLATAIIFWLVFHKYNYIESAQMTSGLRNTPAMDEPEIGGGANMQLDQATCSNVKEKSGLDA
jgi:POT family proton-dependent oligopeptide transporter